ncbi:transposase, partial [Moorellaceae bacterium AZ2]
DRGFGRVELFKKLEFLGFKYIIRVSGTAWIDSEQFTGSLQRFPVRPNQLIDFGRVLYHKKEKYPVRLIYQFAAGQEEPWFLVTNLDWEAKRVPQGYGHRMDIEEKFKDFKNLRTGLGLHGVILSAACRYERLLLVVVYAYFLEFSGGAEVWFLNFRSQYHNCLGLMPSWEAHHFLTLCPLSLYSAMRASHSFCNSALVIREILLSPFSEEDYPLNSSTVPRWVGFDAYIPPSKGL